MIQLVAKTAAGEERCFLKRLVRRSGGKWRVKQFNPEKEFVFDEKDVVAIHLVLGVSRSDGNLDGANLTAWCLAPATAFAAIVMASQPSRDEPIGQQLAVDPDVGIDPTTIFVPARLLELDPAGRRDRLPG